MSFTFTEDQKLLSESANRFVLDEYDFETRRKILNQDGGFDKGNWAKFAELGWLALPIAEEYGGLGGSTVDTAVLLEALGRGLVVEPYQSSIVLGAELLQITGKEEQKKQYLPSLAEGKTLLSFAHIEPTSASIYLISKRKPPKRAIATLLMVKRRLFTMRKQQIFSSYRQEQRVT